MRAVYRAGDRPQVLAGLRLSDDQLFGAVACMAGKAAKTSYQAARFA